MSAQTIAITGTGATSGVVLDAQSTAAILWGDPNGCTVIIEASYNGSDFAPLLRDDGQVHPGFTEDAAFGLVFPAGWTIRTRTASYGREHTAPSMTLVIE